MLAFDYGTRRIGVAVGLESLGSVRGINTIRVHDGKADERKICNLVNEWQPGKLIVGYPYNDAEKDTPLQQEIKRFSVWLGEKFDLPVHLVDERLSTEESMHRINSASQRVTGNKKMDLRNMVAAEIILETFFSS